MWRLYAAGLQTVTNISKAISNICSSRYRDDPVNAGFVSDLRRILDLANIWIRDAKTSGLYGVLGAHLCVCQLRGNSKAGLLVYSEVAGTMRKNTDARVRGGAARSSVEAIVMTVGRRGALSG